MSSGVVQALFPSLGERSAKQSISDEIESRITSLAPQGFTLLKKGGVTTEASHVVASPRGIFIIFADKQRPDGHGAVIIQEGRGRLGRLVNAARWVQEAIAKDLDMPSRIPVRSLIVVPGEGGRSVELSVNGIPVVAAGDLGKELMSLPIILGAHQLVALSALLWIRFRLR